MYLVTFHPCVHLTPSSSPSRRLPLPHHPAGPLQLPAHRPTLPPSVCRPAGRRAWSQLHQQHRYSTGHRGQDRPGQPSHGHPSWAVHLKLQQRAGHHSSARWGLTPWTECEHEKDDLWPLTSAGMANESGGFTFFPVQMSVTGQGGATLQPLSAQTLTGTITVQSAITKPAVKVSSSPLRKGSLSLFFRKVRVLLLHWLMCSVLTGVHLVRQQSSSPSCMRANPQKSLTRVCCTVEC